MEIWKNLYRLSRPSEKKKRLVGSQRLQTYR